jgi:mannose-1-phosphate guanylyltransferase
MIDEAAGDSCLATAPFSVLLLAAGVGQRLRPLTDRLPKCLVPVDGTPLLDQWKLVLEAAHVRDVIVNVHAHAGQVRRHIKRYGNSPIRWRCVDEPVLLGTAGTVRAQLRRLEQGQDFVVAYADNYTKMDLSEFMAAHRRSDAPFTMALFDPPDTEGYGIVSLDREGWIVDFAEKQPRRARGLANAGVYAVNSGFLRPYLGEDAKDLAYDVLPNLIRQMRGWILRDYHRDVGTPSRLAAVERDIKTVRMSRPCPAANNGATTP